MTRHTDLIPSVQERIVGALRRGNFYSTAAQLGGVSKVTLYSWLKRGEAGEEPFLSFLNAVEEAVALAQADALACVEKAAKGYIEKSTETIDNGDVSYTKEKATERSDWRAAAWLLAKRHPEEWGDKQEITVTGLTPTGWKRE